MNEIELKYGCNPNQKPSRIFMEETDDEHGLTMQQIDTIKAPALVAMAVYIGKTRLIDNFTV